MNATSNRNPGPMPLHRRMAMFALVLLVALAGAFPACASPGCCEFGKDASTRAAMPCCDGQISAADRDPGTAIQAASAGSLNPPLSWELDGVVIPDSANNAVLRVFTTLAAVRQALSEPPPQLFLLNAQFLI